MVGLNEAGYSVVGNPRKRINNSASLSWLYIAQHRDGPRHGEHPRKPQATNRETAAYTGC